MSERIDIESSRQQIEARLGSLGFDYEATLLSSDITRAANALRMHLANAVLREYDLSWTAFAIIWLLWVHGPLETRHAAHAASISKATLTGVVNTLEQRKLVERKPREDDRRLVELHLTKPGMKFIEGVFPKYNEMEAKALGVLTTTQRKRLREGLEKLVTSLEVL